LEHQGVNCLSCEGVSRDPAPEGTGLVEASDGAWLDICIEPTFPQRP
jgi:hypothetical protein